MAAVKVLNHCASSQKCNTHTGRLTAIVSKSPDKTAKIISTLSEN
jgi:hypothetical protein